MCPGLHREIPLGDLGILLMGDIDIAGSPHPWNDALRAHPRLLMYAHAVVLYSPR